MAIFVEIKEGVVVKGIVVSDRNASGPDGEVSDSVGAAYCHNLLGGDWLLTSKDGFRKNKAGKGFTYDEERDAFIPPKPFESWVLNEDTCSWDAPVAMPNDGIPRGWDEEQGEWVIGEGFLG